MASLIRWQRWKRVASLDLNGTLRYIFPDNGGLNAIRGNQRQSETIADSMRTTLRLRPIFTWEPAEGSTRLRTSSPATPTSTNLRSTDGEVAWYNYIYRLFPREVRGKAGI